MVTFQQLKTAIQSNPHASLQVLAHRLPPQPIVECFKLPTIRIDADVIPKRAAAPAIPKTSIPPSPTLSSSTEELAPPPMRMLTKPTFPTSPSEHLEKLPSPSPSSSPSPSPSFSQRSVERPGKPVDPLCIAIETQDAMYAIANTKTKQQLECDEARRLEAQIAALYKEESGRSRGWVKTKLEAYFLPRAAVGSRVYSKDVFDWSKIWEKEGSALLDFLCLAKGIRIAVWRDADRTVGLWPAADSSKTSANAIPLYHVGSNGAMLSDGSAKHRDILQSGYRIKAPYSVEHALEKLSLEELNSVAEKLGVTAPPKKADKVRALAAARMRMRLV